MTTTKYYLKWSPKLAVDATLKEADKFIHNRARAIARKAKLLVPVGKVSRPVYATGKAAGKMWTRRLAGSLKKSIKVKRGKFGGGAANAVWIISCGGVVDGAVDTYYWQFIEYLAQRKDYPHKSFMRAALHQHTKPEGF